MWRSRSRAPAMRAPGAVAAVGRARAARRGAVPREQARRAPRARDRDARARDEVAHARAPAASCGSQSALARSASSCTRTRALPARRDGGVQLAPRARRGERGAARARARPARRARVVGRPAALLVVAAPRSRATAPARARRTPPRRASRARRPAVQELARIQEEERVHERVVRQHRRAAVRGRGDDGARAAGRRERAVPAARGRGAAASSSLTSRSARRRSSGPDMSKSASSFSGFKTCLSARSRRECLHGAARASRCCASTGAPSGPAGRAADRRGRRDRKFAEFSGRR